MKLLNVLFVGILAFGLVTALPSCKKDDDKATCTDGIQNGDETGVDCGGSCSACLVGVQGEWLSAGANVAPLLAGPPFNIDSIRADFSSNLTYTVTSYSGGTPTVLTGTYSQTESGVGAIWNITVNQTAPSALTSEGIFEVTGDNMKYEIVQTQPAIGVAAPTAAGGFGSTGGGAFGMANIQNYVRVN
ncbi:MAG: hypothetical protein K9I85_02480 [Saprospiraceae bacterium]|nr:hypothetical protein [Saprospiraceae bacterium]